jgi:homoserine O-acetyltransferase
MMDWPTQQGTFELGRLALQSGAALPDARLSWKAHGTLAPRRDNVIVYPTSFAVQHPDIEWLIGPDKVLDPTRWFIVLCDMFGNGLSSSPSDGTPYPGLVAASDNVRAQQRMMAERFGVSRIACVYGWSMGAQQAYHWAALFPEQVERIVVNCGSARTAPHNRVFLAGLMATLEAAPAPLRAFGRLYAGWALSQDFYRADLHLSAFGAPDLEAYLRANWDGRFAQRHPANLQAHLSTWYHSDISANELYGGDLPAALRAIRARVLLMPGQTDLYFRVADNELELAYLRDAKLQPIPSLWGHLAGNPQRNPADAAFLREAVGDWIES